MNASTFWDEFSRKAREYADISDFKIVDNERNEISKISWVIKEELIILENNYIKNNEIEYSNAELWNKIDSGGIQKGQIIIDQDGNEFIFSGKSFPLYGEHEDNKFRGFCKGDRWILRDIVDFDEEMETLK